MFIKLHLGYADIYDKLNNELRSYKGKSQKKLYQELNLESLRNRRWYRKLFFSIKSKINSPQHVIILICIKTMQVQLTAPDHPSPNENLTKIGIQN